MRINLRLALLATVFALSVTLSAHMKFDKSEPAPDSTVNAPLKTVSVWFTQAPDPKVSKLELTGPAGAIKVTGLHAMGKALMATVDGATAAGAYTLAWQSAGNDGHVQKGTFTFTLKSAN